MTITEIKSTILKTSINNWTMNTTDILGISKDLWYLIQSNIDDRAYQIQWRLADKLDAYRGWGNQYVDNNIKEIQNLYKKEEVKKVEDKERIKDKEVILVKPYEIATLISTTSFKTSFIQDEVNNLKQYIKFIHSPT